MSRIFHVTLAKDELCKAAAQAHGRKGVASQQDVLAATMIGALTRQMPGYDRPHVAFVDDVLSGEKRLASYMTGDRAKKLPNEVLGQKNGLVLVASYNPKNKQRAYPDQVNDFAGFHTPARVDLLRLNGKGRGRQVMVIASLAKKPGSQTDYKASVEIEDFNVKLPVRLRKPKAAATAEA